MAVEVVIKLPEEEYDRIMKSDETVFADAASKECMLDAIKNGIRLAPGHGKMGDLDKALILLNERQDEHDRMMAKYRPYRNHQIPYWMWEGSVAGKLAVIAADTQEGKNDGAGD